MIELSVFNGNIVVCRPETLTSGRVGHKIHFSFDSKWSELPLKFVSFEAGNLSKVIKLGAGTEVTTLIPPEVLKSPGYRLKVGVKGVADGLQTLTPTKYVDLGMIHQGSKILTDESLELIRKKGEDDAVATD